MDKKYKVLLPIIITYFRLGLIPIIICLTLFNLFNISLILIILGFISDYLDNFLANKWNTSNLTDSKIDIIISKTYELVLLFICNLYILLIIELIFIIITSIFYYKKRKLHILPIGYLKEILFIILIIFTYINTYIVDINIINGFIYMTINIQIISFIEYIKYNINYKTPSINDNLMHESIINIKNIEDTIVYEK